MSGRSPIPRAMSCPSAAPGPEPWFLYTVAAGDPEHVGFLLTLARRSGLSAQADMGARRVLVLAQGRELCFEAQIRSLGYTFRFRAVQ